jgi:DNA-binding NarL/FixJ family response regulator
VTQAQRPPGRLSNVEGAAALDRNGPRLDLGPVTVVATKEHQLAVRRVSATVAAGGLGWPLLADGIEETSVTVGGRETIVIFACDVSDPVQLASLRRLRKLIRNVALVVLAPSTDASGVRRALDAGADGLVFESELETSLIPSIAAVAAGQAAVPRRVRGGLHKPAFSNRERQVLDHVAAGLTNSEIAESLFLSESTVKSHLSSAFAKLGVRSRKEAAALVLDPDQGPAMGLLCSSTPTLAPAQMQAGQ